MNLLLLSLPSPTTLSNWESSASRANNSGQCKAVVTHNPDGTFIVETPSQQPLGYGVGELIIRAIQRVGSSLSTISGGVINAISRLSPSPAEQLDREAIKSFYSGEYKKALELYQKMVNNLCPQDRGSYEHEQLLYCIIRCKEKLGLNAASEEEAQAEMLDRLYSLDLV